MWIHEGIVLVATCKTNERCLNNGARYKVKAIAEDDNGQNNFEMIAVAGDNQETGESFVMATAELGNTSLSYAIT